MKRYSVILLALFAGAIAAQGTIKNRLGQMSAKNLAQVEQAASPSFANCDIPGDFGAIGGLNDLNCPCNFTKIPSLGGALSTAASSSVSAQQASSVRSTPDTGVRQICQTNCCECAESAHAALAVQAKNRTFTISGAISVLEQVYFAERERAAEESIARAEEIT